MIGWCDEHHLNQKNQLRQAFDELFLTVEKIKITKGIKMQKNKISQIETVVNLLSRAGAKGLTAKAAKMPRLKDHIYRLRVRYGFDISTLETRDGRTKWVLNA